MNETATVLEGLAALAWPVIAGAVVWVLLPSIAKVIESRSFTVEFGNTKISVEEASNQLRRQIEDLQDQAVALKEATGAPAPRSRRVKTVLWVNDRPERNAYEISKLEADGYRVLVARSTVEAGRILGSGETPDAIVTNLGREEGEGFDPDAGLTLVEAVRRSGVEAPVFVYTTPARAAGIRDPALEAGAAVATGSPVELFAAIKEGRVP